MNDVAEYLEEMADIEPQPEIHSVEDLLNEIENESLHRVLLTVDRRTLLIYRQSLHAPRGKRSKHYPLLHQLYGQRRSISGFRSIGNIVFRVSAVGTEKP